MMADSQMEKMENLPRDVMFKILRIHNVDTEDYGEIGKAILLNLTTKEMVNTYMTARVYKDCVEKEKACGYFPDHFKYYGKNKSKKSGKDYHAYDVVSAMECRAFKKTHGL